MSRFGASTRLRIDTETGNAERWYYCDACGKKKRIKDDDDIQGYEYEYEMPSYWMASHKAYCKTCAKKIIPILKRAIHEMEKKEADIRKGMNR